MQHLKKVVFWYFFAAIYAVIITLLFILLPEQRIYTFLSGGNREIDSIIWENMYVTALLIIALVINGFVIFFISLLLKKTQLAIYK